MGVADTALPKPDAGPRSAYAPPLRLAALAGMDLRLLRLAPWVLAPGSWLLAFRPAVLTDHSSEGTRIWRSCHTHGKHKQSENPHFLQLRAGNKLATHAPRRRNHRPFSSLHRFVPRIEPFRLLAGCGYRLILAPPSSRLLSRPSSTEFPPPFNVTIPSFLLSTCNTATFDKLAAILR